MNYNSLLYSTWNLREEKSAKFLSRGNFCGAMCLSQKMATLDAPPLGKIEVPAVIRVLSLGEALAHSATGAEMKTQ